MAEFAISVGVDPDSVSEGANYLEACDRVRGPEKEDAVKVARSHSAWPKKIGSKTLHFGIPCHDENEQRWFQARVVSMGPDQAGYVLVEHQNITNQKKDQLERLATEERFQKIFESHSAVMLLIEPESGRLLDANFAAEKFYGYSRDLLKKMSIQEINLLSPEEIGKRREEALAKTVECFIFPHRLANGEVRNVEVYSSPIPIDGRHLLFSIVHDITERMEIENERERLISAIEQAAECIVITDKEGSIQYVNPVFEKTTGYSREEVIGQNPRVLKSGRHDGPFYEKLWETISSGETWTGRMVNKKKDGAFYTEEASISPVYNSSGEISSFVAVKRDITQELALEEQLHQSQKMEAVGRLAGGVAHDFNNMLQTILGYSEMGLEGISPSHPLHLSLSEIHTAAERSADLTRQLLAFARKQTISPKILDLNDAVADTLKMLGRLIGEDIHLIWKPAHKLPPISMDPVQIHQILANLTVNARDAISDGGTIHIESSAVSLSEEDCEANRNMRPGEYVTLKLIDDGVGMDSETLDRIFEPFFTTKAQGEGTGLGLATVYGIVKQNEGYIEVDSKPGLGTTFQIFLPCLDKQIEGERGAKEKPPLLKGSERILLVEDEQVVLDLGVRLLKKLGYHVLATRDPREAIRLLQDPSLSIDLLMTDVVMPEMSGRDLFERVREIRPEIKCLFMSGYTADVITHHGILEEGIHFLEKPFNIGTLSRKLREVLTA
ncbi:MAG: PAS domain S-box protein [Candidatus Omnitrophica bacterium]|nr:PAS domain S-box protein [Candidatus Omnitrophota bacterium]